jgi:hypothetical protein
MPDEYDYNDDLDNLDDLRDLARYADLGRDPSTDHTIANRVATRLAGSPAHRTPRRDRARRRLNFGVAMASCGVLAIGGAAASAAVGLWDPPLGNDQAGHPTRTASDVPADQLSTFGVLRREAIGRDRNAAAVNHLRYLDPSFQGVRTARIRAPKGAPSDRYLIVPVAHAARAATDDALCLFAADTAGGGVGCWSTSDIRAGKATLTALAATDDSRPRDPSDPDSLRPTTAQGTVTGLVPDGVAAVEVDGARADVADNFYAAPITGTASPSVKWLASDGSEVAPK